jgi:HEAT repeat protein
VKRSIALLSLSLALVSSVFADERGLAKALEEWQALYRPLAIARGSALTGAAARVERETEMLSDAVGEGTNRSARSFHEREREAILANLDALRKGYAQGGPKERRTLVRLAAILGNRFGEGDVPWYPICESGPFTVGVGAETLLTEWFKENPASHLGLLDDPDARVAEAAVRLLNESFRDDVTSRIEAWQRHPQARFRGIAGRWVHLLGEEALRKLLARYLDDPSEKIRDLAAAELPFSDLKEAYHLRRPTFQKATWAQRRTLLAMAGRLDAPDKFSMAVTCLQSKEDSVLKVAFSVLGYGAEKGTEIPLATLARLRRHANGEIRSRAYFRSGEQNIPMRELRIGLQDTDEAVRTAAFAACCKGVGTVDELRFLLDEGVKRENTSYLPFAARRLGEKAVDSVLPLLDSRNVALRTLGIEMAALIASSRVLPALEKCLTDADPKIREALADHITELPEPTARRWLKALAADPVEAVRERAVYSLEALDFRVANRD